VRLLLGLAGLVGFGLIFELVPRIGLVSPDDVPPTSKILTTLVDQLTQDRFRVALLDTVRTWVLGLAIAVAAGVVLGVLIGSVPFLRAFTASTVEFLRPIPSVALIPLAIVLYGSTIRSTLILVVYAAFWQVLVQVLHGVADVDPVARDTTAAYRLPILMRIRYLLWPTALPYAVTGIRLATSVALILTVTGELIIGSPGLGKEIAIAQSSGATEAMYAMVLITALFGVVANVLTRTAERRMLAWHTSVRREVPA
jgi:ABC-type nitrate/sulfonate/bicarbonate transport system permease component